MNRSFSIILVFAIIFCAVDSAFITFYEHAQFKGRSDSPNLSKRCHNLDYFNNRISSINTNGKCVKVFDSPNCRGKSRSIAPGTNCHKNLKDCGMNDLVSSMRIC